MSPRRRFDTHFRSINVAPWPAATLGGVWSLTPAFFARWGHSKEWALVAFLLSMASVVIWLTVRIGPGLPHRKMFLVMSVLYAGCGTAQALQTLSERRGLPEGFAQGLEIFIPVALSVLAIFMFVSIPVLLTVLRASDEARSLRGHAKFQVLIQAAPMAVVGTDCEGRVTSWNPSAERIFGWTEKEILGTLGKTIPEDNHETQLALAKRALLGQSTVGFEAERLNRKGDRFPVSISTTPLHDEAGRVTGLMTTIEDIRERKRIERELNEKSTTLAVVTQALSTFLESGDFSAASKHLIAHAVRQTMSSYGFLGVVLEGPVLRVLAHEGIASHPEMNGQLYEEKLRQHTAHGYFEVAHDDNLLGEVISKGKTVVSNQPPSDPRSRGVPLGHPPMKSFLGVPISKGSTVVGLIAVANRPGGYTGDELRSLETLSQATGVLYDNYLQNLKRKQLEEQRSALQNEFRQAQKMEVLGQLSGGIAHDFNNMLMVLSGSTELLERTLPPNAPGRSYVEQIRRTTEKAAAITKQLLAFSRKQVLDAKPVDLHEILTNSEFMLPRLLGSDIQLTFQHGAAHSWILADPGQLEQVIANLAINARDAMPYGGSLTISTYNSPTLPDEVRASGEGAAGPGWVVLEVKDTGCGMDEQTRSHLFEPFFTTKPLGKGTGLGLSTVYGTVRQFGGHICLDSQPGLGTSFHLYFSVHHATSPRQDPNAADPSVGEESQRLTILLADDEPSLREAVAEYLRSQGHQILESHSAHDAVDLARRHPGAIDVLLTDVVMPGLRGPELAQRVAESHPEARVIFMSGYAQSLPEAQIPPGASFLQKPFRFASLKEQLKLVARKA